MTQGTTLIYRLTDPLNRFVSRWDLFLYAVIAIFFVRCLISAFSGFHGSDLEAHLSAARGLVEHKALYTDVRFEYPPLHAHFQAFWLWLLGDNPFAAKVPSLIGDIASSGLLYLIGARRHEIFGRWLALCYLLFPLSILSSNVMGLFDSLALALMLLGILMALRNHWGASAASIGIGVMYKFLPILAAVPMLLFLYRKRQFHTIALFLFTVGIISTIIITPFILNETANNLAIIFFTGGKYADSFSIFRVFIIPDRNAPFLIQIGMTGAIFYYVIKKRIFNLFSFEAISLFVAVFMMLNKNLYPHYFIWIFPFIAYWFIQHHRSIWLSLLLIFDSALMSLWWYQYGAPVSEGPWLPLLFQVVNWAAIGFALFVQIRENEKEKNTSIESSI